MSVEQGPIKLRANPACRSFAQRISVPDKGQRASAAPLAASVSGQGVFCLILRQRRARATPGVEDTGFLGALHADGPLGAAGSPCATPARIIGASTLRAGASSRSTASCSAAICRRPAGKSASCATPLPGSTSAAWRRSPTSPCSSTPRQRTRAAGRFVNPAPRRQLLEALGLGRHVFALWIKERSGVPSRSEHSAGARRRTSVSCRSSGAAREGIAARVDASRPHMADDRWPCACRVDDPCGTH
jgi:hypothetical protein